MNRIVLEFDPDLNCVAGTEYGQEVYNSQVKGKLNFNEKAVIEFPERIKTASSSFVGGFLGALIDDIGKEKYEENVCFSGYNTLTEKFYTYFE